jgi:hypothetical protein
MPERGKPHVIAPAGTRGFALPDRIQALAFVLAFLVGMAGLSLLGRAGTDRNMFERFVRLHNFISPQSYFYPTASQLLALIKDAGRDADVIVVIGGDSIMQGFGQSDDELWSRELQRLLGDRYAVVNIALYNARFVENGGMAVDALTKEGYNVIQVSDLRMPSIGPPEGADFRYLFWDAYYKELLTEDGARTAYLDANPKPLDPAAPSQTEMRLRSALDSELYFTDFWNRLGYTTAFTAWAPILPRGVSFSAPRRSLSMTQDYLELPFDPRGRDGFHALMISLACQRTPNGDLVPIDNHPHWSQFSHEAAVSAPPAVRARSIIWTPYSRDYTRANLSRAELDCYLRSFDIGAQRLASAGYRPALFGADWEVADYLDHYHLVGRGGQKLAREIAPRVETLAEELGYLRTRAEAVP